ncbi:MAG: hypothetical protein ABJH63_20030 [Rhizobiaceae bacterium]
MGSFVTPLLHNSSTCCHINTKTGASPALRKEIGAENRSYIRIQVILRLICLTIAVVVTFFGMPNLAYAQNVAPEGSDTEETINEDSGIHEFKIQASDSDGSVIEFRVDSFDGVDRGRFYTNEEATDAVVSGDTFTAVVNAVDTNIQEVTFWFVPAQDFTGFARIRFIAIDDNGDEDATVNKHKINIDNVNDAPIANQASASGT